jgi:hypothetical protein
MPNDTLIDLVAYTVILILGASKGWDYFFSKPKFITRDGAEETFITRQKAEDMLSDAVDKAKTDMAKEFGEERGDLKDKIGNLQKMVGDLQAENRQLGKDLEDFKRNYADSNKQVVKLLNELEIEREANKSLQDDLIQERLVSRRLEKELYGQTEAKNAILETIVAFKEIVSQFKIVPIEGGDGAGEAETVAEGAAEAGEAQQVSGKVIDTKLEK